MIKLIAFLGNYGAEYKKTRHNVAWLYAEQLPFYNKLNWQQKFKGEYAVVDISILAEWFGTTGMLTKKNGENPEVPKEAPEKIFFLKPLTYMNLSGESIIAIANFYKIKPDEVLVIHDELELPLGTISLKWSGGLGGHNGLRSTKGVFGTADFWRLRFGISKPINANIADYVLSNFTEDEQIVLSQIFSQANELFAKLILSKEPQRLIQNWGKKKLIADTN